MNQREFERVFERIQDTWPGFKAQGGTASEWFNALKPRSYTDVNAAVTKLQSEEKFPPSLASIFGALAVVVKKERAYATLSPKERLESDSAHVRAGFVRVLLDDGAGAWEEEWRTVFDNRKKCRRMKIDFVCDYMGGKVVTEELKTLTNGEPLYKLIAKPGKGEPKKEPWTPKYYAKLDAMVKQVQEAIGA